MLTATDPTAQAFVVETPGVEVRGIVQRVLWNLQTTHKPVERRRGQRLAYPYPLKIWPAENCQANGKGDVRPVGDGVVVMGKHLSIGGVDFYSREPIADRRVIVSLNDGDGHETQVLLELTWCRFGGHGLYVNGGRFIRVLADGPERISP